METTDQILEYLGKFIVEYGITLLGAVVALIAGLWIINIVIRNMTKLMQKRQLDPSLIPFLSAVLSITLKIALIISIAGMVGIEMTSFIAILGAAGLAIGLAMQGTLQNFAGGVMILLFKPFKVGDFITAEGHTGTVMEIQIFNTLLTTPDNKVIIIPNGGLANSSMINFSTMATRRVDFSFGIGYDDDFEKAKELIHEVITQDNRILKEPEPFVRVGELGESSVNITTRVWVNSADYWLVHFDMLENVKKSFDKHGISIPFPQIDVHMDKQS